MRLNGKPIELHQLKAEADAAGVIVGDLGTAGDDLVTYDAEGHTIDVPPEMAPVLAAHIPPTRTSALAEVRVEGFGTMNATQQTLVSWPLAQQTLYTARFTLMAIDTGNGDCRVWTAKASAKRVVNGALMVGAPTLETSHADAGAASWQIAADTSGNNFRIRVTGAAGRTISWSLLGEVIRARPDGLVD